MVIHSLVADRPERVINRGISVCTCSRTKTCLAKSNSGETFRVCLELLGRALSALMYSVSDQRGKAGPRHGDLQGRVGRVRVGRLPSQKGELRQRIEVPVFRIVDHSRRVLRLRSLGLTICFPRLDSDLPVVTFSCDVYLGSFFVAH